MIAFGPVPSRRLERSLGINNIPPKVCTYSCVYCQLGRTIKMKVERGAFYEPDEILQDVHDKVEKAREAGEAIDYLTFVPDGEPALDINLGREIELLRPLGIKIAVRDHQQFPDLARGCERGPDGSRLGLSEDGFRTRGNLAQGRSASRLSATGRDSRWGAQFCGGLRG